MSLYSLTAMFLSFAVGCAYLSYRYLKIPSSIGVMSGALIVSTLMIIFSQTGQSAFFHNFIQLIQQIPFGELLMKGMLGFLLFAGAMSVDISTLKAQKWEIATLAVIGTLASTFCIAFLLHGILIFFHVQLPLAYCLLFGALISPTDPIAVLAIFKASCVPKQLVATLEGESLFNDGIGIVIFLTIYQAMFSLHTPSFASISWLFLQEAFGGVLCGFALGSITIFLIRSIDSSKLTILLTLATVTGGYTFAQNLDLSGPLAMVVAGLLVGNMRLNRFSARHIKKDLSLFWDSIDEILNAMLFLFIGFEILVMPLSWEKLILGSIALPVVLLIRYFIVSLPIYFFKRKKQYVDNFVFNLTWGGLRGGLAIALALTIPRSHYRDYILAMTYVIVLFSILVQGLTIRWHAKKHYS